MESLPDQCMNAASLIISMANAAAGLLARVCYFKGNKREQVALPADVARSLLGVEPTDILASVC
ncbi:hypothetical protein EON65_52340 [archaeon]|nr:MAG: hypothetical protein EON65_52340 [archaeon]